MSGMRVKLKPCAGDDCKGALRPIWKRDEQGRGFCKYCWQKSKPVALKPTIRKPLPSSRKPIAKRSSKRAKQELAYSVLRKAFLKQHPECQALISKDCTMRSSECHHKAGRIGGLLCDDTKFLAVCSACHFHIENNREQAIELGFSELRLSK